MTTAVPDILARIVEHKKAELENAPVPLRELEKTAAARLSGRRDFAGSLRAKSPAIIAEIKKASPSKGLLTTNFQPAANAVEYEAGGAAALSVLTDSALLSGQPQRSRDRPVSRANCPPFARISPVSEYHVVEAAAHGADAILLIAAILTKEQMRSYRSLARRSAWPRSSKFTTTRNSMTPSSPERRSSASTTAICTIFESRSILRCDSPNAFPMSVIQGQRERHRKPRIKSIELRSAGFNAFLIGEHLMRSGSAREALSALTA